MELRTCGKRQRMGSSLHPIMDSIFLSTTSAHVSVDFHIFGAQKNIGILTVFHDGIISSHLWKHSMPSAEHY